MHTDHLGIMLNTLSYSVGLGWDLRFDFCIKLPGDADAVGPQTTSSSKAIKNWILGRGNRTGFNLLWMALSEMW